LTSVFLNLVQDPRKSVFAHVTCATNTSNIKMVFNSVRSTLLKDNLDDAGIGL